MTRLFSLSLPLIVWSFALVLSGCPQFSDAVDDDDLKGHEKIGNDAPVRRDCSTIIYYHGAESAKSVAVSGEFNNWVPEDTPLEPYQGGWRAELEVAPGHYAHKFVIDGEYEGDPPPDQYTKWLGDYENRNLIVENCRVPQWKVISSQVSDEGLVSATFQFQSAESGAEIDPTSVRVTVGNDTVEPQIDSKTGKVTIRHQATDFGKYSVRIWGADTHGVSAENNPFWLPLWHEENAFTWQDATMYLIFTDRFRDSDGTSPLPPVEGVQPIANYKGGDFRGITDAIEEDYFDELGVNLLWLSPINENTNNGHIGMDGVNYFTGYHGYWTIDPLRAETRYGDAQADADERLKELVSAAHKRGIRVMIDLVLNQVHEDHIYCQERPDWCSLTCVCGTAGCGWDERTLDCQFMPYLPDLNYRNHEIVERVIDDTLALMKKFDVDALRIDAAKHMDHVIMRTLRLRLNELEAQGAAPFYLIGETYTGAEGHDLIMRYVADYELHSQFDFPLLYPIRASFGHDAPFQALESAIRTSEEKYGASYAWSSPFVGNHDIPRFATEIAGNADHPFGHTLDLMGTGTDHEVNQWNLINRISMAHAFLLTQPGIPLIYYGDEVGLAGGADPDNRRMMPWELNANRAELLERIRTLGQARRNISALRHGARKELWIDDHFYVYARDNGNGDVAIVALNKDNHTRTETVTIPASLELSGKKLISVNSSRHVTVGEGQIRVTLDSWEYAIFYVE